MDTLDIDAQLWQDVEWCIGLGLVLRHVYAAEAVEALDAA